MIFNNTMLLNHGLLGIKMVNEAPSIALYEIYKVYLKTKRNCVIMNADFRRVTAIN